MASSRSTSLEESSGLEDILEGMRTMELECIQGKSPEEIIATWEKLAMKFKQEIHEHPVAFGLRLARLIITIRGLYVKRNPECFPNIRFDCVFKNLDKSFLLAYQKGLRNEELKMLLEEYEPKEILDAIFFVNRVYKKLNAYYQEKAQRLWINTDLKCKYCTKNEYHLYDCLLPKTN